MDELSGWAAFSGEWSIVRVKAHPEWVFEFKEASLKWGEDVGFTTNSSSTQLTRDSFSWRMCEHFLAAALFYSTTPKKISMNVNEFPMLDGSAEKWAKLLSKDCRVCFPKQYDCNFIYEKKWENGSVLAVPAESFEVHFKLDLWGIKETSVFNAHSNISSVLKARTFISQDRLEDLRKEGVLKKTFSGMARLIDERDDERIENECAKHKILDLLGDLAILGPMLPKMKIVITNGNHYENQCFIRKIKEVLDA